MGVKLGRNAKLYYNAGSYNSPTWTEVPVVRDVTLNQDTESADADSRSQGLYGADVVVKINLGVDFEVIRDTSLGVITTLEAAFYAASAVEFLVLDGPVGTTGSRGVRATCNITKWTRGEQLKEIQKMQASIKPTYAANPPSTVTI